MPRTPKELVAAAAEMRRAFSLRWREFDALRKKIVLGAIRDAEQKKINEIRNRYV
jgi:hypothetical protein